MTRNSSTAVVRTAALLVLAGSFSSVAAHAGKGDQTADPRACRGAQDARVLEASKTGVVYKRDGRTFGCLYAEDTERALPKGGRGVIAEGRILVVGRFATYVVIRSGDAEVLTAFDLRRGRLTAQNYAVKGGSCPCAVRAYVVKTNGSLAWIGQGPRAIRSQPGRQDARGRLHVYRRPARHRSSRRLASGNDIAPWYLRLTRDFKRVVWKQDGDRRSARLR